MIKYFEKQFAYAIQQHKDNAPGVNAALLAVVPHAYGDHSTCGEWCKGRSDPAQYRHTNLPNGKPLADIATKQAVADVFDVFAGNADKLAPMESSQQNEALNNVILSKLPKTKFYGGSESNDFRVAAAVLQKNTGKSYVSSVCTSASLSPGKHAEDHAHTQSVAAERQLDFKSTKTSKRRRNELKSLRSSKQGVAELREGTTYSTG